MFGYIILRDIPKEEAQLDFTYFKIQGGFRGFAEVEPGIHYITVKDGDTMSDSFWCFVKPNDAVIKIYDYISKQFNDCNPEEEQRYKAMTTSGAMNQALIPIKQRDFDRAKLWKVLTYLIEDDYPFSINSEEPMIPPEDLSPADLEIWYLNDFKSRFDLAFQETHSSNVQKFLQEMQYTYIRFVIVRDAGAYLRWAHLIQAVYNAGEKRIEATPELFEKFIILLQMQFSIIMQNEFTPNNELTSGLANLIDDMLDTGIESLVIAAKNFTEYLETREIKI